MSLTTPTKSSHKLKAPVFDDERLPESPDSESADEEQARLEAYRKQWVGEVDLPERE